MSLKLVQFTILIVIAEHLTVICDEKLDQSVYIRGLLCNASDKYVYPNFSCFPKSWSRTISTMNVVFTFRRPINEIYVEAKLFYKYGMIYREVIHTPRFEYCKLIKDYLDPKIPTPLSVMIQFVKDCAPEAIHQCPYTEINVRNRTVNVNALKSLFPAGEYKTIYYAYARNNEPMGVVNVIGDMISPLKESFGKK